MKELTLAEAIEALKKGKRIELNVSNVQPKRDVIHLDEKGNFVSENNDKVVVWLGFAAPYKKISDFEGILNRKRFVLVEDTKPILKDKEKEYLRNIIKPFKKEYEATTITKVMSWCRICYIDIELLRKGHEDDCHEDIKLPYFSADDMYKGMEAEKRYTLEELGL